MRKINSTTFQDPGADNTDHLEAIIGDEKQAEFYPRVKLKAWNNEANLSIGIVASPDDATVEQQDGQIHWRKGSTTARFYNNQLSDTPTKQITVLKNYDLEPWEYAVQYELGQNSDWSQQTIELYSIKDPTFVYYGFYPADDYLDLNQVEQAGLDELRIAPMRASSDPMYVDNGLKLIDIQYQFTHDLQKTISKNMSQAITDVLANYDIQVETKPDRIGKFYFRHDGKLVKFASVAQDIAQEWGHYNFYINLDCDYNQAYDYYLAGKAEEANRDGVAYGLKAANADIDESVVDEIIARYAELMGTSLNYQDYSDKDHQVLGLLKAIHENQDWVRNGQRDDPYMYAAPQNGLEFDVIIDQKPASNVYDFSITTKNLEFHYQSPLTEEEKAMDDHRSPHVVGSYAAYHPTNKHNEYKAGKAFHIYRPVIEDSHGWKVFGELNVDTANQKIAITIPQDFLDYATYPITIDPTIGYITTGATSAQIKNRLNGQSMYGAVGTVSSVVAYIGDPGDGTARHKVAIYKASNDTLLKGSTEETTNHGPGGEWVTYTGFSSQVISNQGYYLEAWGTSTGSTYLSQSSIFYDSSTGPSGIYKDLTYVNGNSPTGWPTPVTWTNTIASRYYSIYINYTAGTSGTTFSIVYGNYAGGLGSGSSNWTHTISSLPTPTAGNLLVMMYAGVQWILANLVATAPSGYTLVYNSIGSAIYYRVATGSEGSSLTATINGSAGYTAVFGSYIEVSGFTATPELWSYATGNSTVAATTASVTPSPNSYPNLPNLIVGTLGITAPDQYGLLGVTSVTNTALFSVGGSVDNYFVAFADEVDSYHTGATTDFSWNTSAPPVGYGTAGFINTFIDTYTLSVNDSSTVTESTNLAEADQISVNDTSAITENVVRMADENINKSDSSVVTDPVVVAKTLQINVNDNTAITDNVTTPNNSFAVNVSDSATVTDNLSSLSISYPVNILDSTNVTDNSVSLNVSYQINVSDSTTLTEFVRTQIQAEIVLSDSTTVTDSTNVLSISTVTVSENSAVSEDISFRTDDLNIAVTDSTAASESKLVIIVDAGQIVVALDETTILTDVSILDFEANIALADGSTVSDSVTLQGQDDIDTSDTLPLTENVQIEGPDLPVNVNDSSVVSESKTTIVNAASDFNIITSDLIDQAESVIVSITAVIALLVAVNEIIAISDSPALFIVVTGLVTKFLEFFE